MITKKQLKHIRSLQQKKYRDESGLFVVEGIKLVNEAIEQIPLHIRTIVHTNQTLEKLRPHEGIKPTAEVFSISPAEFSRISSQKNPQQVLAVIEQDFRQNIETKIKADLILALDRIQDPGNLGTIIRLANWFGISEIVCSNDTVDCFNPKVIQASMGAILRVAISYKKLTDYLWGIKNESAFSIYGTTLNGTSIYDTRLKRPAVIILGNEANGVSAGLLSQTDTNITIPAFTVSGAKSESLNVSMTAAIICSEFRRR